ncbi:hypothetical protein ACFWJ5_16075 [Streptomyces qaidamensis]|uniref:hypothetical protein n=1 Tax=Streptomyces qaidamensis TaxID=1783515 RepID=UPI003667B71A
MVWFLGLGITGVVLLALSLFFDGVLDGALDGALGSALDGWLSLPVVAGTGNADAAAAPASWRRGAPRMVPVPEPGRRPAPEPDCVRQRRQGRTRQEGRCGRPVGRVVADDVSGRWRAHR